MKYFYLLLLIFSVFCEPLNAGELIGHVSEPASSEKELNLFMPFAGTQFSPGQKVIIRWQADDPERAVRIELFLLGARKQVIKDAVISRTGSFHWEIPDDLPSSHFYTIRVRNGNGWEEGDETGYFSIIDRYGDPDACKCEGIKGEILLCDEFVNTLNGSSWTGGSGLNAPDRNQGTYGSYWTFNQNQGAQLDLGNRTDGRYVLAFGVRPKSGGSVSVLYGNNNAPNPTAYTLDIGAGGNVQLKIGDPESPVQTESFNLYAKDQWSMIYQVIDLHNDQVQLYNGTQLVTVWPYSSGLNNGTAELGSLQVAGTGSKSEFALDGLCFVKTGKKGPLYPDLFCKSTGRFIKYPGNDHYSINEVWIINMGNMRSEAASVCFYLSEDEIMGNEGDIPLGSVDIPGLNVNNRAAVTFQFDPDDYNFPGGSYFVGYLIDCGNKVPESDEVNNSCYWSHLKIDKLPPAKPNLFCKSVGNGSVSDDQLTVSNITIGNNGTATAGGSRIAYYLSINPTITADDILLGTDQLGAIPAGGQATTSFSVGLSSLGLEAGNYYVGYLIDDKNEVMETNESDNTCSFSLQYQPLPPAEPDLACKESGTLSVEGDNITINGIWVANMGNAKAGASNIAFFLSKDTAHDPSDIPIGEKDLPMIPAGGQEWVSFQTDVSELDLEEGSFHVIYILDFDQKVMESDEFNNLCKAEGQFSNLPDKKPDLVCKEPGFLKIDGTEIEVQNIWVGNMGDADAGAFKIAFFLSADYSLENDDILIGTKNVSGIAAGGQKAVTFKKDVKDLDIPPGTYYVIYQLDAHGDVMESDEQNNICGNQDTYEELPDGKPDLLCKEPGKLIQTGHQVFLQNLWLANMGDADAGAYHIAFYLSPDKDFTDKDNVFLGEAALESLPAGEIDALNIAFDLDEYAIASGNYFIGYVIDYKDEVMESDENNNVCYWNQKVKVEPKGKPNLVCSSTGTFNFIQDTLITFSGFIISNTGNAPSGVTQARLYLSDDDNLTTSDQVLATIDVPALDPSASFEAPDLEIDLQANPIPAGTLTVGYIIDFEDKVDESKENDNACNFDVPIANIPEGKPDLLCKETGFLDIKNGVAKIRSVWIANMGDADAGSSHLTFYLSTNKTFTTSDKKLKEVTIPALKAGEQYSVDVDIDLGAYDIPEGHYYLGYIIDSKYEVHEENEHNNVCYWNTVIKKLPDGKPDLLCKETGFLDIKNGVAKIRSVWIANMGDADAGSSHLTFYLSTNKTFTTSDKKLKEVTIPALKAGEQYSVDVDIDLGAYDIPEGHYYLGYIIDSKYEVHEENEHNNVCYWNTVIKKLPDGKPDLLCKETGFLDIKNGVAKIRSVWIANMGDADAGSSHLTFYLSTNKTFTTSDKKLKEVTIPALKAGEQYSVDVDIDLGAYDIPEGHYYLGYIIDSKYEVHEENEHNNVCYWNTVIKKLPDGKPDLLCKETGFLDIKNGVAKIRSVWIANMGDANAGSSHIAFYLSTNKTFTTKDLKLKEVTLPALKAGEQHSLDLDIDLKGYDLPEGHYYLGYIIDSKHQVHEQDEHNNICYWNERVEIMPKPVCKAPKGIHLVEKGYAHFYFAWDGTDPSTVYQIRYRKKYGSWTYLNHWTGDTHVSGLKDPCTTYEWQIRVVCGDNYYSSWSTLYEVKTGGCGDKYCPSYALGFYEWIDRIEFAGIDHNSGKNYGYGHFTDKKAVVDAGEDYPITLIPDYQMGYGKTVYWQVWIDFNQDHDFNDAGEQVLQIKGYSDEIIHENISIPADAKDGETRMRITLSTDSYVDPCATHFRGETEDYKIHIDNTDEAIVHKADLLCGSGGHISAAGSTLYLDDFKVQNAGKGAAAGFKVGFFLSKNKNITTQDEFIGSVTVSHLPGNALGKIDFSTDLSHYHVPAGEYYLGVLIDYLNTVHETEEYNNSCYYNTVIKVSVGSAAGAGPSYLLGAGQPNGPEALERARQHFSEPETAPLNLQLSPNPALDYVQATITSPNLGRGMLEVMSMTGQVLRTIPLDSNTVWTESFDVSDLPKGLYLVRVTIDGRQKIEKLNVL